MPNNVCGDACMTGITTSIKTHSQEIVDQIRNEMLCDADCQDNISSNIKEQVELSLVKSTLNTFNELPNVSSIYNIIPSTLLYNKNFKSNTYVISSKNDVPLNCAAASNYLLDSSDEVRTGELVDGFKLLEGGEFNPNGTTCFITINKDSATTDSYVHEINGIL